MLLSINVPIKLINILLYCISSSQMTILINGNPTYFFEPTCGVRQGDLISPYLFILGMGFLSLLINRQTKLGIWKPIPISANGPFITHSLFDDAIFLFVEASLDNASCIKNVLDVFTSHNGHKINSSKSKIFLSNHCFPSPCNQICDFLSIPQTKNLENYLGFPLMTKTPKHSDFSSTTFPS